MSRLVALTGAIAIAIEVVLPAPFDTAGAHNKKNPRPPVTVQAPPQAAPKRVARKPENVAAVHRRTPRQVAAPQPAKPPISVTIETGGVNAASATPPVVA